MTDVRPASRVSRHERPDNAVEVYAYSKAWPLLFPQHGSGLKHKRDVSLRPWQQRIAAAHARLLLRGLIHSDGCRFINTGRNWRCPRYAFSNRSQDIRGIFCFACEEVGVRWNFAPHTVFVSRKADVNLLNEFIGPKR